MPEHLNVCIRVRPLLGEREEADGSCIFLHEDQRTVEVEGNRAFSFDSAFGPRTSQNEMFAACGVRDLMEKLLDGVNCSLIVYGQTGSGKTFSLWGDVAGRHSAHSGNGGARGGGAPGSYMEAGGKGGNGAANIGLVPRAINYLFDLIERETAANEGTRITVRASVCEIYAENVFDLLNVTSEALPVKMAKDGSFFTAGQAVLTCPTRHEALAVVSEGERNRTVGSHALNKDSSRSHTFLTLMVEHTRMVDGASGGAGEASGGARSGGRGRTGGPVSGMVTTRSKAVFVDLAGSERLNETKAEAQTAVESRAINKSLFTLGKVISGLAAASSAAAAAGSPLSVGGGGLMSPSMRASNSNFIRRSASAGPCNSSSASTVSLANGMPIVPAALSPVPAPHIPYRDSKLTKLLQDCLGGSAMTIIIACISPAKSYLEESLNTLGYAARARRITAISAEEAARRNMVRMDPRDGLIGSLKDENKRLKEELEYFRSAMASMTQQQRQLQRDLESARMTMAAMAAMGTGAGGGVAGAGFSAAAPAARSARAQQWAPAADGGSTIPLKRRFTEAKVDDEEEPQYTPIAAPVDDEGTGAYGGKQRESLKRSNTGPFSPPDVSITSPAAAEISGPGSGTSPGFTPGASAPANASGPPSPFNPAKTTRQPMAVTSRDELGKSKPGGPGNSGSGSARFPRISEGDEKKDEEEEKPGPGAAAMPQLATSSGASPGLKKAGSSYTGGSAGTGASFPSASSFVPVAEAAATPKVKSGQASLAGAENRPAAATTASATGGSPS